MVKLVRIPLTDAFGRDFMTGQQIPPREVAQSVGLQKKLKKWLKFKKQEAKNQGRKDGKVFVEGLGRVKL